jgi:hypothetical protein
MGIGRADESGMGDALLVDVVDEVSASADQGIVLDTGTVVGVVGISSHS